MCGSLRFAAGAELLSTFDHGQQQSHCIIYNSCGQRRTSRSMYAAARNQPWHLLILLCSRIRTSPPGESATSLGFCPHEQSPTQLELTYILQFRACFSLFRRRLRVCVCVVNPRDACEGDAVCQGMETLDSGTSFSWDHARTMRMGITGAFLVTPASFSWNLYAERIAPGTSVRAVVTKLGVSIAVLPPMVSETKGETGGAPSAAFCCCTPV